jgi:hypothetical protein
MNYLPPASCKVNHYQLCSRSRGQKLSKLSSIVNVFNGHARLTMNRSFDTGYDFVRGPTGYASPTEIELCHEMEPSHIEYKPAS